VVISASPYKISAGTCQNIGIITKETYGPIAIVAKQPSHLSGPMVVVYRQPLDMFTGTACAAFWLSTNGANAALVLKHLCVLFRRQAITPEDVLMIDEVTVRESPLSGLLDSTRLTRVTSPPGKPLGSVELIERLRLFTYVTASQWTTPKSWRT